MTNLLNAIGKIKTTFKLMIMWLVLTWILMPILGIKFGYNGVAVATALISISSILGIYLAQKEVNFDLFSSVGRPLLASIIMGLIVYFFRPFSGNLGLSVMIRVGFGGLVYLGTCCLLFGRELLDDIQKLCASR
jgi:O-antigen/teichoic acid export membrane protein